MHTAHIIWPGGARSSSFNIESPESNPKQKCTRVQRKDENNWDVLCGKPATAFIHGDMHLCANCLAGWRAEQKAIALLELSVDVPYEVIKALGPRWLQQQLGYSMDRPRHTLVIEKALVIEDRKPVVAEATGGGLFD